MFGPVSGGHFNPVVSLVDATFGGLNRRDALAYIPAQIGGCILGAMVANAMFSQALASISTFAGIAPASDPGFILAQLVGGVVAIAAIRVLYPDVTPADAADVVLPHSDGRASAAVPAG